MKSKFAVASYEVLLSGRPSQLYLEAEVKDYFHSSELNLDKQKSSDFQFYGDFPVLFFLCFTCIVANIGSTHEIIAWAYFRIESSDIQFYGDFPVLFFLHFTNVVANIGSTQKTIA